MAVTKIDDRGLTTPIDLLDNEKIRFGTGNDVEIYHDGSESHIKNNTGALIISTVNGNAWIKYNSDNMAKFSGDAEVALYYNGNKKFETLDTGAQVTGDFNASNDVTFNGANYNVKWLRAEDTLTFYDNAKAGFGANNDLKIYHDGTSSFLDNDTGDLRINTASGTIEINKATNEYMARFITDGGVELYHDNSKRVETQSTGVKFLATDGSTVRGRVDNSAGVIGIEHTVFYPIQVAHNGTDASWGALSFAGLSAVCNSDDDRAYIQFVSHPRHRGFGSVHMWYGCSGTLSGDCFDWDFTVYNAQANSGYTSNSTTFTITTGSMSNGQLRKFDISSNLPSVAAQDMVKVKIVFDELIGGSQVLLMGMQVTEYTSA